MNQLVQYFLAPYQSDSTFLALRKTRLFVLACLYDFLVVFLVLLFHLLGAGSAFFVVSDVVHLLLILGTLWMIHRKRLELATNLFIIAFTVSILISNVLHDYVNQVTTHYLRILETALLFTLTTVIVSLFTFKRYHIILVVAIALAVMALHYWLLISKFYNDVYSNESLLVFLVYSLFMVFVGIMGMASIKTNKELIDLVEKEAEKVKRLNQSLESKVMERTRQLEMQNKELEKVNNELDRFVYRVSHDLRAPLASVLGLISITREETDLEKIREYLELKEKSVAKLDHFIQDVIHLSKNARTEMEFEEIDFSEVIQNVFEEHSYSEQALKIEMHTEIEPMPPFYSDKERLKIVLRNLVSNSIRYSNPARQNPFVKIKVNSNGDTRQKRTRIEISDNGLGISDEHIDKVFDMFYRASSEKAGTGLGLYIVKETVEKLMGTIQVTSQLGEGTSFIIELADTRKQEVLIKS
jgi:signal transduction histidine kinase